MSITVLILKYKKSKKTQSIKNNELECVCIKIIRKNAKNVIISCISWPPTSDSHNFLEESKILIRKNHEKNSTNKIQ